MKKLFIRINCVMLFFTLIATSCNTHKKIVYFQGEITGDAQNKYTPTLKVDDFLSIMVLGDDHEAVVAFNLPPSVGISSNANSGYIQGTPASAGYLIDANGNVELPVLGSVTLAGLNRMDAIVLIQKKLMAYINNPVVNIQILNFKITVLGEVNAPGTFKIPNERITLLEAIGLAGDLKITGLRKNILVVRENNGKKEEFRVDLTSNKLFNSPVYYLQQNDVIYIEPNSASRTNSTIWKTTGGVFISITSLIITTVLLISK